MEILKLNLKINKLKKQTKHKNCHVKIINNPRRQRRQKFDDKLANVLIVSK